jgi:HEAT repeat protein
MAAILAIAVAGRAMAQVTADEANVLAQGWALLAKGDAVQAGVIAARGLAEYPHSTALLALAVDADVVRAGWQAGLETYERWLGPKRLDNAHALRRIATAALMEASTTKAHARARLEALRALASDGDRAAAARLEAAASERSFGESRVLAESGNEQAIKILLAQLQQAPGSTKTSIIDALARSGSTLPVPALQSLLADPDDLTRASAAAALGQLEARSAIPQLQPLLKDPVFAVRMKAAGALFRLNDSSGLSLLLELANSEHATIRVAAAKELAPQPDAAWQSMVRGLAADPDPLVRLEAARLIAPYDQPLASSVLDGLMRHENIGIREAASTAVADQVASDFDTLRRMLRTDDLLVRVKAAGRILELTR